MNLIDFKARKLGKRQLVEIFEKIDAEAGYRIASVSEKESFFKQFVLSNPEGKNTQLNVFFRNVSTAGWADKPEIKRIQIPKLPNVARHTKDNISLLCGIGFWDEEPYLVTWDPLNYLTHNTVCSCYVFFSSIEKAQIRGFYNGINEGKEVMVCRYDSFDNLLNEVKSRYL